uniref:Uncharacterized protein n=1 Tax=Nelumbo nucifera TaxID=4432 RepID=A0A822YLJ6_NELNU|nr:TPA_asm: hypothetical protein HUJ06_012311 [Nelumbo nucifera]
MVEFWKTGRTLIHMLSLTLMFTQNHVSHPNHLAKVHATDPPSLLSVIDQDKR